ncbi:MAG: HAD hydrolase family protein, partial [Bacteroidales bacterium]|nr:HAD hydrolase family protein [Bacteroidales bacterium]
SIKAFVFDYDGVMTDGNLWIGDDNIITRGGNVKDGYALQYAIKMGYIVAIISGGKGDSICKRMNMLGIDNVFTESANKKEIFSKFLKDNDLTPEQVLFMGDDIPDYDLMLESGVATCPSDAVEEIKSVADYISNKIGGAGCVRDVIEQVMRLHNKWFHQEAKEW